VPKRDGYEERGHAREHIENFGGEQSTASEWKGGRKRTDLGKKWRLAARHGGGLGPEGKRRAGGRGKGGRIMNEER